MQASLQAEIDRILAVNIFRYVVATITVVGNGTLLFLFYKFKKLRIPQCNLLILMMNFCDFLIGVSVLIRTSYTVYANAHNITLFERETCLDVSALQAAGYTAGETVLVGIAADRFLAVYRPVTYSKNDSKSFVYFVGVIAIVLTTIIFVGNRVNVDYTKLITVCTAGAAQNVGFLPFNLLYIGIFIFSLFIFYTLTVIFAFIRLKKIKNSSNTEKHEFRIQFKMFINVSWILLSCFIAFGIPNILQLIGLIYDLETVNTWNTLYVGFSSLISAAINSFLYLFKYKDINHCLNLWIKQTFLRLKSMSQPRIFTILNKSTTKT